MTPYEHLAVLVSIVIGLGLVQLLISLQRLVQARGRVVLYWLPLLWAFLLLVTLIEWWWAFYALRQATRWNFFYFLFILLSPISLYLAVSFVLPDVEGEEQSYDLRQYYFANRRWFFLLVAVGPVLDGIRRALQAGTATDFGAASNFVSAILVGALAFTSRPRVHAAVTLAVTTLFGAFLVTAALELR